MKNTTTYITGTSKGIGKALAEEILAQGGNVVGFSRSCTITHPQYSHHIIDLSDIEQVDKIMFNPHPKAEKITLINNAGSLGEIAHLGTLSTKKIQQTIALNMTCPFILCNKFIAQYKDHPNEKFILNMSSGAGKNPYDGWSEYCATKAGIDMLTKVADKELNTNKKSNFTLYACSPGVVETEMQSQIRTADQENFSLKQNFIDMYKNNINKTPKQAAKELIQLIQNKDAFKDIFPDFWQG